MKLLDGTVFPILSIHRLEALLGHSKDDLERIATSAAEFYHPFDQRKPKTSKFRHIDNPTGELRKIQDSIQRLLRPIPMPPNLMGGISGRSTKSNASRHVGQPWVVTLDLKSCFPYTTNKRIYGVFKGLLCCSSDVANLLTRLTTYEGHLPQGAPTSTTLCNLALLPLHDSLLPIAVHLELGFTVYIDDITFSGKNAQQAIEPTILAARSLGYIVPCRKKKIMHASTLQKTTGIGVNRRPTIERRRYEEIRKELIGAAKYSCDEKVLRRLKSRVSYVKFVNPKQGRALESFAERAISGW